jgi:hypothetical protein
MPCPRAGVIASCIIHNWVIEDGGDELIMDENDEVPNITHSTSSHGQASEHAFMVNFRQEIANTMWEHYQQHQSNDA